MKYGSKYDPSLSRKEIAARVRADIKAAVQANDLPRARYSVRFSDFGSAGAIDVTVKGIPMTRAVERRLESMVAAYNYDGSGGMTDVFRVKFYAAVHFDR